MKCSSKKHSSLCSADSTSPYFLGCSSCETLSEFDVQQSPVSESLSLKMGVLPQQCHNTKPLTDQSYPIVGSTKSGIWIETLFQGLSSYELILLFSSAVDVHLFYAEVAERILASRLG